MTGLATAVAVDYPATADPLSASPTSVEASTVTVKGGGFAPSLDPDRDRVTPTLLATVSADGSGSFSTTVTIPASIEAGAHTLGDGCEASGGTDAEHRDVNKGSGGARSPDQQRSARRCRDCCYRSGCAVRGRDAPPVGDGGLTDLQLHRQPIPQAMGGAAG